MHSLRLKKIFLALHKKAKQKKQETLLKIKIIENLETELDIAKKILSEAKTHGYTEEDLAPLHKRLYMIHKKIIETKNMFKDL